MSNHQDFAFLHDKGVDFFGNPKLWANDEMAMDAQPTITTTSNSGVPQYLTQVVDPDVIEVLFSPMDATEILPEAKRGSWEMQTAMFPMKEIVGEVTSYGDYATTGHAGLNTQYEYRQSYLYQTIIEYGELEEARQGLAHVPWAAELTKSAISLLNRFQNLSYFYGIAGLENYGLFNDPALPASISPATKAWGGTTWFNGNTPAATANEVYNDILAVFQQLTSQAGGFVSIGMKNPLTLALSPFSSGALIFTNTFGISVEDLLKKNFPNLTIKTAVQYGAYSTLNIQGNVAGNFMQMIAPSVGGQETGFMAFNEKLRTHRIVADLSSFKQKATQGTWGAVLKFPAGISSMIGI